MDNQNNAELTLCIDKYARQLLKNALGFVLFNDFDSQVTDGVLNSGAVQKWIDLVNGAEYTKDDKVYKWQGLIYAEGLYKNSLLAKYVFYNWYKENVSTLSGIGEVNLQGANSVTVEPNQRLVTVWNSFLQEYQHRQNNNNNANVYLHNGTPVYDWYRGNENDYVSLLHFLTDKATDYPDAPRKEYKLLNQFGL
ncbi:MAG: hypothetical protein H7101_11295 [Deinococcales bacterium]|nr:hypothetical protein [Chitinophagaceae bacterium]